MSTLGRSSGSTHHWIISVLSQDPQSLHCSNSKDLSPQNLHIPPFVILKQRCSNNFLVWKYTKQQQNITYSRFVLLINYPSSCHWLKTGKFSEMSAQIYLSSTQSYEKWWMNPVSAQKRLTLDIHSRFSEIILGQQLIISKTPKNIYIGSGGHTEWLKVQRP